MDQPQTQTPVKTDTSTTPPPTKKQGRPKGAIKKLVLPPGELLAVDNKKYSALDFTKAEFAKYSAVRDGAIVRITGAKEGVMEMPISSFQFWIPYEGE